MIPPLAPAAHVANLMQTDKVHLLQTKDDVVNSIKLAMFQKFFIETDDDDPQKIPNKIDM